MFLMDKINVLTAIPVKYIIKMAEAVKNGINKKIQYNKYKKKEVRPMPKCL
jgi:hypothetical protein